MRALIRVDLSPAEDFNDLWNDREQYDAAVIALFREIGYVPKAPRAARESGNTPAFSTGWERHQHELATSREVADLFQDVPEDIADEEQRHMIMLGYTSEGQSTFLVCAINPAELHIRFRQGLFERLRRSCVEITRKLRRHHGARLTLKKELRRRAHTRDVIEVMETKRDIPTIRGEIISSALSELGRRHWPELLIALITLTISTILFFETPNIASPTQAWLAKRNFQFTPLYIGGAFERIYSAFLVTFSITALTLIVKLIVIFRSKPIKWNSEIEPRSDAGR